MESGGELYIDMFVVKQKGLCMDPFHNETE